MEIKNLEQALKLQRDLVAKLTRNADIVRTGKGPSVAAVLKDKKQRIAEAQAAVEAILKDRDAAVTRWDERVAQRQQALAQLESELVDLNKQLTEPRTPPNNAKPSSGPKKGRNKK